MKSFSRQKKKKKKGQKKNQGWQKKRKKKKKRNLGCDLNFSGQRFLCKRGKSILKCFCIAVLDMIVQMFEFPKPKCGESVYLVSK